MTLGKKKRVKINVIKVPELDKKHIVKINENPVILNKKSKRALLEKSIISKGLIDDDFEVWIEKNPDLVIGKVDKSRMSQEKKAKIENLVNDKKIVSAISEMKFKAKDSFLKIQKEEPSKKDINAVIRAKKKTIINKLKDEKVSKKNIDKLEHYFSSNQFAKGRDLLIKIDNKLFAEVTDHLRFEYKRDHYSEGYKLFRSLQNLWESQPEIEGLEGGMGLNVFPVKADGTIDRSPIYIKFEWYARKDLKMYGTFIDNGEAFKLTDPATGKEYYWDGNLLKSMGIEVEVFFYYHM